MAERLKQIWSGFEKTTTRRLTGRGVDNIETPTRRATEAAAIAPSEAAPAEAAFAALKSRLSGAERRAQKQVERRAKGASYDAAADLSAESAGETVRDLVLGLAATEKRIARPEVDYASWLSANPKAGPKLVAKAGARKKIFGIF